MPQQAAVQIRHLTKAIGKKTIVDDLSFDIPEGEVFGFLGPNGAGKTTTIRMMVGLITKTRGKVFVYGTDVDKDFRAAMNRVGAIVENPELYKFLTGYQNLKHFARMSTGVGEERIREVVKLVGLEQRIHDKVKTYSLGMRQRLGLAQALLRKPDVLILDEPTNGLDPAGIRELRDHLRTLAKRDGVAVIVSSHLLSEMELMCDRVAIIQSGKLVDVRTIRNGLGADEDTEQTTEIQVDDGEAAVAVIRADHAGVSAQLQESAVVVSVTRDKVPEIVRSLVVAGIKIYAVNSVNKSLEDTFLEITGGGSIGV
ncbi:putative ABC transporter ATP-binding protein YhcH [Alicyclobacillus contaminans]|uniref:ABC transporter ATP-binding protein n=1 Tax=Alicyclobacillus contaminans TaxID=392016 RepID=UPI00042697C4|nr:ABC transporter ATP-binding protein [Alicyclobacillus contaminans]GMA50681.1 putative ABC transporter ATP-binding protein YhcH [Alicyclobacillus contaminans]